MVAEVEGLNVSGGNATAPAPAPAPPPPPAGPPPGNWQPPPPPGPPPSGGGRGGHGVTVLPVIPVFNQQAKDRPPPLPIKVDGLLMHIPFALGSGAAEELGAIIDGMIDTGAVCCNGNLGIFLWPHWVYFNDHPEYIVMVTLSILLWPHWVSLTVMATRGMFI